MIAAAQNPDPTTPEPSAESAFVRCADCLHCKCFKDYSRSGRYVFKLRCAKGKWTRGQRRPVEMTPPLHMLMRRRMKSCLHYESLSDDDADRERYLAELKADLPNEQYIYEPNGAFADMTEVSSWHPDA
jgi:hypothetical protein